jgi:two-component system OmpR family sensor kinase
MRTKLVIALIGLLAVACVVISGVTEVALSRFLIGQLDGDLRSSASRAMNGHGPDTKPGSSPTGSTGSENSNSAADQLGPAQAPGTLVAWLGGTHAGLALISNAQLNDPDKITDPAILAILKALPADRKPYTRDLGSYGSYRLIVQKDVNGDLQVIGRPESGVDAILGKVALAEILVTLGALLLAGSLGAMIVRRSLHPLRRVAATATRVSELPLDRGEVALSVRVPAVDTDPATEVGQVGAALNRMLRHVAAALTARQESETRVRQFVADASHELRTPLAAIRGYAELTRRVHHEVPDDVAHAMRRVESEATRMTSIVEDLLLLARLDSGRPLAQEPVDVTLLIVDSVSDAQVAGREHRWQLDLPPEPVKVTGDAVRLHQVLVNLLANARTHTPPGTTVTVSLLPERHHVTVTVADNGPGIPPALLPDVFERFARGDSSRSRAAGSTGLGLAIVSAVVEAHHGTVTVDSVPGRTVFTVRLPVDA